MPGANTPNRDQAGNRRMTGLRAEAERLDVEGSWTATTQLNRSANIRIAAVATETQVAQATADSAQAAADAAQASANTAQTTANSAISWLPQLRLNYRAVADLATALAVPAATWTTIGPSSSFTTAETNANLQFSVCGNVDLSVTLASSIAARLVIDLAGTPVAISLGGLSLLATSSGNALCGSSAVIYSSLAAGAHTVTLQVYSTQAAVANCRPSTVPATENLSVSVIEFRS